MCASQAVFGGDLCIVVERSVDNSRFEGVDGGGCGGGGGARESGERTAEEHVRIFF